MFFFNFCKEFIIDSIIDSLGSFSVLDKQWLTFIRYHLYLITKELESSIIDSITHSNMLLAVVFLFVIHRVTSQEKRGECNP